MATHAVEFEDDFAALVARTQREMIAAGENRAAGGIYEPPFGPSARKAIMNLVNNGIYREAANRVALEDPDLADL